MDRIELDNLTRTYYDAQGETFCALDHASLIWEQGHSIAIMGESGSGKSTLARLMIGLERPSEGRVLINGVDTTKWGLREWRKYRGKIQAVFQDAGGTLNPSWSTSKNVEEALVNLTDLSPSQRKNRIAELMEQTGLSWLWTKWNLGCGSGQSCGGQCCRWHLWNYCFQKADKYNLSQFY